MWDKVSSADGKNFMMSLGTSSKAGTDKDACAYNLPCGHAYSLLGVATVFNADKSQSTQLYIVRNPWRKDNAFTGSFADGAAIWNTVGVDGKTYGQQVGLVIADDGVVYMTGPEVKLAFEDLSIAHWRENYQVSWYDKKNDNDANATSPAVYSFTLTESTPMTIRSMIYNKRMYPFSCKQDKTLLKLILKDANKKQINYVYYYEESYSFIDLNDSPLAPGKYTLEFYPKWTVNDTHDYGIVIDSPKDITITDASGAISRPT
jgi:hypothetical protein